MSGIIGNSDTLELMQRLISRGREPHSVMICGERGLGKKTLARELAARLLCERQDGTACGVCRHCRLIANGSHPDLVTAEASATGNYKVDDIRALVAETYITPSEGRLRVFLIPDLDRSPQTLTLVQNIMLKVIEEPPEHAVLILTARSKELFLETIISRTLLLTAEEVSPAEAMAELQSRGCEPELAEEAVRRCGGNIGRGLDYCGSEDIRSLSAKAADICRALSERNEYKLLLEINGAPTKRQDHIMLMEYCERLVRDAVRVRTGTESAYLYSQEVCRAMALRYSERKLADIYDIFSDISSRAAANCQIAVLNNALAARLFEV